MSKYLENLVEERETLAAAIEGFTEKAATEGRDLNESELAEVNKINARAAEIDNALDVFGQSQAANSRYAELMGRIQKRQVVKAEKSEAVKSWGSSFTDSTEFRSYSGRGTSGVVEVPFEVRAGEITTSDAVVGSAISSGFSGTERFPLLGQVNMEPVSTGAVEWIYVGRSSDAVETAETVAKTQATLVFTPQSGALKTLAHWVPITRQAAEDNTRLTSIVEGRLKDGVFRKMNKDISAALVAATLPTATGADMLTAIRNGIAEVESEDIYSANTVLLNPLDYAALDLAALASAGGMSAINRQGQFWDLKAVSSAAVAQGTAYVGDFKAVSTFYRKNVAIYMTDSHSDFFVKNQLVVLAEIRALSTVTEAAAIAECTVTP